MTKSTFNAKYNINDDDEFQMNESVSFDNHINNEININVNNLSRNMSNDDNERIKADGDEGNEHDDDDIIKERKEKIKNVKIEDSMKKLNKG